jgi:methyl-accepting chemotaxis protein
LLSDRLAAIEASARENEAINNSAIGLLSAVFTLSERDLTVRAAVNDNIVGTIASSINQFTDETANTLSVVQRIAQQVDATVQEAKQQSLAVEDAVIKEKELLVAMGDTLNEASRQLTEVALLSENSSAAAERTTSAALAAQNAVNTTVRGMETLRAAIADTEKRFKQLSGRSQEISSAVALINTISERTHVLSLNAAIQAAEAGEAGRGFAVVAQEVQRLSDTSRLATGEITAMVNNIQAETNETLFTLNQLIADVVKQTDLAQGAESEMDSAQTATQELVKLVERIGSSSQQQQTLAKDLRKNIDSINDSTAQTTAAITQQNQATLSLVQYSLQLKQSISQFKLEAKAPVLLVA